MSVRGDILDTLKTRLEGITAGNGYNVTVDKVLRDEVHIDQLAPGDVWITIIDSDTEPAPRQYAAGNKIVSEMSIILFVQVRPTSVDSPPTTELSNAISDLRELIQSPINLGSYVRFVELGSIGQRITNDDRTMFDYTILINYWFDADSP